MSQSVCVVGLGIIGAIWNKHYASEGLETRCWNRTPKPQEPGFVADLAEAVRGVDVVHICVADPPAVQEVLNVVLPELKPNSLLIQSSTISPAASTSFATQVREAGAAYVEAPFTGSKPAAEARQLVFFLGGKEADRSRAAAILQPLSRLVFPFDTVEQAAAIKLSMNLQIAAVAQALTEGWHLARHHGLSHEQFFAVLRENVAHSGLAELKEPKLASGDTSPQFSVKHMAKDLGLALASSHGLHLRQAERTREIYLEGMAQGLAEADFIALESLIPED